MNEKEIAPSCVLHRAGSYDCSNQLNDNICALLSMINTIAHNICTRMGWTTVNYRINRPFNLNTMCEEECRNQRLPESPDCKCCLLRRYIKTIIMNEFPYVKISGLNITALVTFVDYCFNQLFLQDNIVDLRETIKRQLSNYRDEECKEDPDETFVVSLTNIFTEIKGTEIKSITFDRYILEKGKLFVNDSGSGREIRGIDIKKGLNNYLYGNLYGIIDEHGPLIYNLGGNQLDPSLNLDPRVLCRNNQEEINRFMEIYLANMKNDPNKNFDPNKQNLKISISESIVIPIPINELFSSLSEEVKQEKYINKYLTKGHTMVLKCIFEYSGKYWVYFKNSWGTNIGLNGEDIAPLDTFLNCTIFLTRFPTLLPQDELFEKNIRLQKLLLLQISQKQNKAEKTLGETLGEKNKIHKDVQNYEKGKEIDTNRQRVYRGKPTDLVDTLAKKRGKPTDLVDPLANLKKRGKIIAPDPLANLKKRGGNRSSSIKKTRQSKRKKEKGKKTAKRRRKMRKTRSKT